MQNNLPGSGILDAVVFKKVKAATGGRLRFCFVGAAVRHSVTSCSCSPRILLFERLSQLDPIPYFTKRFNADAVFLQPIARETQEFISMTVTPMIIGYGMTETCA